MEAIQLFGETVGDLAEVRLEQSIREWQRQHRPGTRLSDLWGNEIKEVVETLNYKSSGRLEVNVSVIGRGAAPSEVYFYRYQRVGRNNYRRVEKG